MSQEKYKRAGYNWKEKRREEAANKVRDDRFMHLVHHLRKIDLQDINVGDSDEDSNSFLNGSGAMSGVAAGVVVEEEDWDNPKPSVDLRTFNFSLPGILCPFCRQNLMDQDMKGLLICSCTSTLKTGAPIQSIKQAIQEIVVQHAACPSNQSPDYTMFKSRIVLTCTVCALLAVVS